mgnify:CR=1 FL=1
MKAKWLYLVSLALVFSLVGLLLIFLLRENKYLFLAGEFILLLALFFAFRLYQRLIKPMDVLSETAQMLKEKDFSTGLKPTGQKEMDHIIGLYNRMAGELREERIRQEEQNYFLEKVIDASPAGILILHFDESIYRYNPAAAELLNIREAEGAIRVHNIPLKKELQDLKNGEQKVVRSNGIRRFRLSRSVFMDKGGERPFIMIEELSRELIKAEKQSYEKIIRMMAHEVNNTVGAVNSVLQTLLSHNKQMDSSIVEAIEVSQHRNENLNRFMENFSRLVKLPEPHLQETDLLQLSKDLVQLQNASKSEKNIEWKTDAPGAHFPVQCDAVLMEQALLNILKNSKEAIEKKGRVEIQFMERPRSMHIRDNGCGISKEVQQQLFTPFYSSKPDGQGIGLMLVREVLTAHGFSFHLRSEDNYTSFSIYFQSE